MKTLNEIVGKTFNPNLKLEPRVAKERKIFNDTSVPKELFKNIYSDSEYDALFKGTNIKPVPREAERHGYSLGNDAKVYEETDNNDPFKTQDVGDHIEKAIQKALKKYKPRNPQKAEMPDIEGRSEDLRRMGRGK